RDGDREEPRLRHGADQEEGRRASARQRQEAHLMTIGAGKYDDLCTLVRKAVGLVEDGEMSGAVMVIVLGGNRGNGFSMQSDLESLLALPELLENVASQIRKDRNSIQ